MYVPNENDAYSQLMCGCQALVKKRNRIDRGVLYDDYELLLKDVAIRPFEKISLLLKLIILLKWV